MTETGSTRSSNATSDADRVADATLEAQGSRWRQLLGSGSPREILSRIVPGDPLGVREVVARRLSSDAVLLDADRVHLRALARCARVGARYTGRPEFAAWIHGIVGEAVEELLAEDAEPKHGECAPPSESAGATRVAETSSAFVILARPLGLEPEAMRNACREFNRMAFEERSAFFDLVLRRRTLDELARSSGESATECARRARRALEPFLRAQSASERISDSERLSNESEGEA